MIFVFSILTTASVMVALFWLWPKNMPSSPSAGERGFLRQRALNNNSLFKCFEPVIKAVSMRFEAGPFNKIRPVIERPIENAGTPLGLSADEFLAVCTIAAFVMSAIGSVVCVFFNRSIAPGIVTGAVLGLVYPFFKLDELTNKRRAQVSKSLPGAIDLIALSMEAGLDFPGALRQVTPQIPDGPLRFELECLMRKLSLGWSREDAINAFAKKVPIFAVRQFASAVTQSEKRGTPLSKVLSTQANVMRTKRSQAAEQAAARASILMLGPLMLIFICVFIILLGPFAIKMMGGGIF